MKNQGDTKAVLKPRKMSIRAKVLIPVNILIILVCSIMGLATYFNVRDGLISVGTEQAIMASKITQKVIDGDLVEQLTPGCETTDNYQTVLAAMRNAREKFGILYMYTLYEDNGTVYYGVDADTSETQVTYGEEFEVAYEDLEQVFQGEGRIENYIDYSGTYPLISAYMPIYNGSDEIVGILGCDYNASEIDIELNNNIRQIIIITVICTLAACIIISFIVGHIIKKLKVIDSKIYDLVNSDGDLTQTLEMNTGDELELIADNVNKLLVHIREIMQNIAFNSSQLNVSAGNVVNSLYDAEGSITDVSATIEEMSAAMEETSASLNQINEATQEVYQKIQSISDSAASGYQESNTIMKKAADIYEDAINQKSSAVYKAQSMAKDMNDKIEKSKAVKEISILTDNILSITQQTNLLSLNASIEAARAGDAGRGFAVVAGEIGNLAANSAETAVQIQEVSADVIQAVDELAATAEEMLTFLEQTAMIGYDELCETSESYQNAVKEINEMMQRFAQASENVKYGIDQIRESIAAVNTAVEESTEGITTVAEMSANLTSNIADIQNEADANKNIAGTLDGEVNKFKLE